MKNSIGKHLFHAVLLIALIIFAFWFALKDDMEQVLSHIKQVSIPWLIVVIFMGILYYVLQGFMLYIVGRRYEKTLTLHDGIENAYAAAFFNGVTPLGGGQVAQTYVFHKRGVNYSDIASILWKDFFLYQCVVVIFALLLLLLNIAYTFDEFPTIIPLVYLGLAIDASVILILWTMSHFPRLYTNISDGLIHLLHRIHIVKNPVLTKAKWNAQIEYFSLEVKQLKEDKKLIVTGLAINLLRQIIYYSIPFFVGIGIGLPLSFSDLFTVWLLSCCIHMMNALTPLPGDTGWTESVFIVMFGFVFQRVYASSIMIFWRTATYYVPICIGGIIFFIIKTRKKHVSVKEECDEPSAMKKADL